MQPSHSLGFNRSHKDSAQCNNQQIFIYLRQTSKIGVKIIIPSKIKVLQLMKRAELQFNIPVKKQILYIAAKKYNHLIDIELKLEQGSIVHVHNTELYCFNQLTVFLQEISKQKSISRPIEYRVKSQQKIIDFIKQNFQIHQLLLVQSGRKLDLQQSFKQNQIQNQSTISFNYIAKQLNHDQFEKDFNKLFQQEQQNNQSQIKQNTKQMEIQMEARAKQWKKKKLQNKSKIISKMDSSQSQMENYNSKPNFKKKKSICLKAVKVNPQNNQYIWKRDSSYSVTKNENKRLKKAIKGKKKKQANKNVLKMTQNQVFSKNAKLKLKQEIQKLFLSDNFGNLGLRPAQKNKLVLSAQCQKGDKKSAPKQLERYQNKSQQIF